jgi:hypothetical protein
MSNPRIVAMTLAWVVASTSLVYAQDLSRYREFQLGTNLVTVAEQAGIMPEPRMLHQRPALIQELAWYPPYSLDSPLLKDSVKKVLFSFYDGQLFRILVDYDRQMTEGLTTEDMVEALSTKYGLPTLSATEIASFSSRVPDDSDNSMAHWEDVQYSVTLLGSTIPFAFELVASSKELEALAAAAVAEAVRLDKQEAPQREFDRQNQQREEKSVKQDQARRVNKATFRP